MVASVTDWAQEEVLGALFDGWVADLLVRASRVVVDTKGADKRGSGAVFGDTTGNVAQVVGQCIRSDTRQTDEIVVVEGGSLVGQALVDDGQAELVVGGLDVAGNALGADVVDLVVNGAVWDSAVSTVVESDPAVLALVTRLSVGRVN